MCFCLQVLFLIFFHCCFASEGKEPDDDSFDLPEAFVQSIFKNYRDDKQAANDPLDPILSAECEPITAVANCVNVVSGQFFQIDKDLKGNTINPLSFTRYYDSGNQSESFLGLGFGSHFPLWASDVEKGARHNYGLISEREGFFLPYRDREEGPSKLCFIDPRLLKKGYTNLNRSTISGHANFINWRARFRTTDHAPNGEWRVRLGDGTMRVYGERVKIERELRTRMQFPTKTAYLLTKEIKPNRNELHFSYDFIHAKHRLTRVKALNSKGVLLNTLKFSYEDQQCTLTDDFGNKSIYHYQENTGVYLTSFDAGITSRKFLQSVESTQNGLFSYEMTPLIWKVGHVTWPEGQYLKINYESGKVQSLYRPLDTQDPVTTYTFRYHHDRTDVYDALNQLTTYHIDDHMRLSKISYLESGKPIREDHFEWKTKQGQDGWLRSKSIQIGNTIYYLKTFHYDARGNILSEALYGNLTGEKNATFLQKQKTDRYAIQHTYYPGPRNLVQETTTPEGLTLSYAYHPKTNLCAKTLCKYQGKIQERTFCTYDDNGEIATLIEDDGSSEDPDNHSDVTFRKIKKITAIPTLCAAFGKPEKISDYYLSDTGETLFKETHLTYDSQGNEILKKVFDSQGIFAYSTTKTYDERNLLTSETNPLGHTTRYKYDQNRNKIEEELIESGKIIHYTYDYGNRLKEKKEIHESNTFSTTFVYNFLNQLIEETDPYGQKTTYTYDRLGNQTKCTKPPIQDENGKRISPTSSKSYNALNQAVEITDENDHKTQYVYNLYGSPTKITYPDQSQETFLYYPCGWLKEKRQADSITVSYNYDAKGHLLKETHIDKEGHPVKWEEYLYKGPLLLSKKDNQGCTITYRYDRAGRKIKETFEGLKTIYYTYDDFDRLIKKEDAGRIELLAYDSLDRPISKMQQDTNGKIFSREDYEYDIQGNQIKKALAQTSDQFSIYTAKYQSDGRLQWKENPYHHRSSQNYRHNHTNNLNQSVLETTYLDPLGRATKETEDAHHRLSFRNIIDGKKIVSSVEFFYDPVGHLAKELTHVIDLDTLTPLRQYAVLRTYNNRGLLESETELPSGKKTVYLYDSMKRLVTKIKPDGVKLSYTYDSLSHLKSIISSDQTIHYTYTHDSHGNLTKAYDKVHNLIQIRHFDPWDRLEWEEINGIKISYTYDAHHRPTQIVFPDQSSITYTYDAFHLLKTERFGKSLYVIECSHDLQSRLIQTRSPAGIIKMDYDLLERQVGIHSSHWETTLDRFDAVGNLLQMTRKDPSGILQEGFAYDRLDQLQFESTFQNHFFYDSLGNCLSKNNQKNTINTLNQLTTTKECIYTYDSNGNLKSESSPFANYTYDALNRLVRCETDHGTTSFLYDALSRCIEIKDNKGTRKLLYQDVQEVGSLLNNHLDEFRLIHPEQEHTFAIELQDKIYFPVQDPHNNISALQNKDGALVQWLRYSAFGEKQIFGEALFNPWRYANRRETSGLILFAERLYNPRLMRWQTPDPIGFEDGLNLYHYVHNNPFVYRDPDGKFAFVIPFVVVAFGTGGAVMGGFATGATLGTIIGTGLAIGLYQGLKKIDSRLNRDPINEELEEEKKNKNEEKNPPYYGEKLGNDPTKCPGKGFEWKGQGGPETGKGSWVKGKRADGTLETLHPDLKHPTPKAPHWDYEGPDFPEGAELYLDGTWKPKEF